MELLDRQLVGFDDYLSGHLNTLIGYLGILVAGRYAKKFIARMKKVSENKVFVFVNLSGAPIGNATLNEWQALEKSWWRYGSIRIVTRHVATLKECVLEQARDYDVKVGAAGGVRGEGEPPIEEKLEDIIRKLRYVPTIDIIVICCPHFERIIEENTVCRACKFYAEHGSKCPYSRDLKIVFMEVKSTRSKGEYEVTESQKETLNDLKKLGYEVYLVIVNFKDSIQKPLAMVDVYAV